jgi:hypothetical protein
MSILKEDFYTPERAHRRPFSDRSRHLRSHL